MRSHAEMRQRAQQIVDYPAQSVGSEDSLARDVLALLDELGEPLPHVEREEPYRSYLMRELLVMYSIVVTVIPALLIGKYVSWWLALGLWAGAAIVYLYFDSPKWRGGWLIKLVGVVVGATYGPIMLVYNFLATRVRARILRARAEEASHA